MVKIRLFNKMDKKSVRQICCDVADRGEPIENFFPDREFAADILMSYYTDYEPESFFVAESEGKVVAYINGCLDNRRYGLALIFLIVPKIIVKGFVRGVFFRKEFWQVLKATLKNWRRIFLWRKKSFHSDQGHLHIGVSKDFRRQKVGELLANAFLIHAKEHNASQITASVYDGNIAACRFFETLGFIASDRYPMVMAYGKNLKVYHSVSYVKKFFKHLFFSTIILVLFAANALAQEPDNSLTLKPNDRILILAPHPDDEVLGTGGVIQRAVSMHLPIKIVFFTYGDSNEWSFLLYRKFPVITPGAVKTMGLVRKDEAVAACSILGVDPKNLIFLGYPDFGTLNIWYQHWNKRPPYRSILTRVTSVPYQKAFRPGAPYKGEDIVADLRTILKDFKPTKIFVSHPADHNGDHLALYLYTQVALWDLDMAGSVEVYPYLIHYLGWPTPKGFKPGQSLVPPESLSKVIAWKQFHLSQQEFDLKKAAIQAHKSQYASTPGYLLSFVRYNELFGNFPVVKLHANEDTSVFIAHRKIVPTAELPEELNSREKMAFVGVEWKFVRWQDGDLIVSIELSKPLAQDVEAFIYIFGYSKNTPFGQMPKISVRLGSNSYSVYDQARRIDQSSIRVKRTPNEVTLAVPLALLGNPDRVLTSAHTYLDNVPLDSASWITVQLY